MTLRITLSNISGFTGDNSLLPTDPDELQFYLPSAVESVDNFSVDVKVEGKYPVETTPTEPVDPGGTEPGGTEEPVQEFVYADAIEIRCLYDFSAIGITYTQLSDSEFRLSGIGTDVFDDQFYKFKMVDYSEKVLPPNLEEPFLGLIQYQMPNPTFKMLIYGFEADIPESPEILVPPFITEPFELNQWWYWYYQTAVNNVLRLNSEGLK